MSEASSYFSHSRQKYLAFPWFAGLATLGLVGLLLQLVVILDERNHQQANEAQLAEIRTQVESTLNLVSNASAGFSFYIQSYAGVMDEEKLAIMAEQLLNRYPMINNVALIPDNVIRWNFPLEGNEETLGVDLSQVPGQAEAIAAVKALRRPLLTGPVELLQGGQAIIHRVPVFIEDQQGASNYWGLVSTPILLDQLFKEAGIAALLQEGRLALRGRDGQGAQGMAFAGEHQLFVEEGSLKTPVRALDGEWQLAFVGDQQVGHLTWLKYLAWPLALIVGSLVYLLLERSRRQKQQLALSREALANYARRLKLKQKEEERLNYVMAHHFQEPARRLVIFSEQLARQLGSPDEKASTSLAFIRQQAQHLLELVKSIQRFMEVGSTKVKPASLSLDEILKSEIKEGPLATRLQGHVELLNTPWPRVAASEKQLRQLFLVLLKNACHHAHSGEALQIRIQAEVVNERLEVCLEDNGQGLDSQYFSQALELFVCLDPDSKDSGTGLGLPLAKRFVEQQGGRLQLEKASLGGLAVRFDLPLAAGEATASSDSAGGWGS